MLLTWIFRASRAKNKNKRKRIIEVKRKRKLCQGTEEIIECNGDSDINSSYSTRSVDMGLGNADIRERIDPDHRRNIL